MCRITNKFILCSCATDLDLHDNHWVLNRMRDGEGIITIGLPIMPCDLDPEVESYNVSFIEEMINQGNCFDFETEFQEKDQLVLFINSDKQDQGSRMYAYEFSNQKWSAI